MPDLSTRSTVLVYDGVNWWLIRSRSVPEVIDTRGWVPLLNRIYDFRSTTQSIVKSVSSVRQKFTWKDFATSLVSYSTSFSPKHNWRSPNLRPKTPENWAALRSSLELLQFLTHLSRTSASCAQLDGRESKVAGEKLRSSRPSKPTPANYPQTIPHVGY